MKKRNKSKNFHVSILFLLFYLYSCNFSKFGMLKKVEYLEYNCDEYNHKCYKGIRLGELNLDVEFTKIEVRKNGMIKVSGKVFMGDEKVENIYWYSLSKLDDTIFIIPIKGSLSDKNGRFCFKYDSNKIKHIATKSVGSTLEIFELANLN